MEAEECVFVRSLEPICEKAVEDIVGSEIKCIVGRGLSPGYDDDGSREILITKSVPW